MEFDAVKVKKQEEKKSIQLLKNKSFLFLWLSSTFSFLALSTYLFTEQWYIITVLDQEAALGIVMMITMIPRVILMTVGGVWADRIKRSKIMIVSSLIRCLLVLAMVLFLQLDWLLLWPLIMFAFSFGVVDAFFSPANTSLTPMVVSKEDLTRANSFIQSSNQSAMFLGPMIGGWILTIGTFNILFLTISLFLFLTFIFSLFINENENETNNSDDSTFIQLKEGFSYVLEMPFLKNIIFLLIVINFFFFGPLLMGIPLLVENVIQGEALDLSFLQSSYQGGMLFGAILVGILNLNRNRGHIILYVIGCVGFLLSFLGYIPNIWTGIILLLLMGISSSFINVLLISSIQEKTHVDKIGRVMSLVNASSNGLVPLSYAFVSLSLYFTLSISTIMLLCGIVILIISMLYIVNKNPIKQSS
ncbi:Predicted arabinose efflux permease, MFS family [Salinibacillus kushneri]|uniref:Predicted arabinose efflux permease, MFS family n=1 Tax=Salinibacillus kushneri TaxID=237682 RepID=A0A1I0HAZ3_9BACI|nr:MFS transporter [Salinibacillus kushneri]SET80836.1 Predicted arabinose efflux permease, MFS family [Salinibacillus kushneri]